MKMHADLCTLRKHRCRYAHTNTRALHLDINTTLRQHRAARHTYSRQLLEHIPLGLASSCAGTFVRTYIIRRHICGPTQVRFRSAGSRTHIIYCFHANMCFCAVFVFFFWFNNESSTTHKSTAGVALSDNLLDLSNSKHSLSLIIYFFAKF